MTRDAILHHHKRGMDRRQLVMIYGRDPVTLALGEGIRHDHSLGPHTYPGSSRGGCLSRRFQGVCDNTSRCRGDSDPGWHLTNWGRRAAW